MGEVRRSATNGSEIESISARVAGSIAAGYGHVKLTQILMPLGVDAPMGEPPEEMCRYRVNVWNVGFPDAVDVAAALSNEGTIDNGGEPGGEWCAASEL